MLFSSSREEKIITFAHILAKIISFRLTTSLQLSAPNLERGVEGSRRDVLALAVGGEAVDAPLVSLAGVHVLHGVRLHVPFVQHDHLK